MDRDRLSDPSPVRLDQAGYVRLARRTADLSQRELAKRMEISQAALSRIESGGTVDLGVFEEILAAARLRLRVVDADGADVALPHRKPMIDAAGRRLPAHLEIDDPLPVTLRLLLREAVPTPPTYFRRPERDRVRSGTHSYSRRQPLNP